MLQSCVGRLRLVGMVEGVSYLVLMGVAMPLKYLAGIPEAVMAVGWVHGVLFIAFCVVLLHAKVATRLSWGWAGVCFLAALLPLGPFVIDGRLKREAQAWGKSSEAFQG